MKWSIKILLALVAMFAILVPMFLKGPDGSPIMDISDWLPGSDKVLGIARQAVNAGDNLASESIGSIKQLSDQPQSVSESSRQQLQSAPQQLSSSSGKMYKWQDANGRWHFSSEKPDNLDQVTIENLPDVENVMDAPVEANNNGSMMGSDIGNIGDMLEKVKQAAAERNQ